MYALCLLFPVSYFPLFSKDVRYKNKNFPSKMRVIGVRWHENFETKLATNHLGFCFREEYCTALSIMFNMIGSSRTSWCKRLVIVHDPIFLRYSAVVGSYEL